jgi:hypothetical protein
MLADILCLGAGGGTTVSAMVPHVFSINVSFVCDL